MHSLFVLILFGCLLIQVIGRPQQAEYNNDSDLDETVEDDDNESAAENYSADEEDSRLSDQESNVQEDEVPRNRHLLDLTESRYLHRNAPDDHTARTDPETVADSKASRNRDLREENPDDLPNYNEEIRAYPKKRRQLNRYVDANDEQEIRFTNQEIGKSNRAQNQEKNQVNKRTIEPETTNEEGDMIFERNREQVSHVNKNEYNANDASDSEQPRYFKQYYNTMQAENRDIVDDKIHENTRYNLRDRRDIKEVNQPQNSEAPNIQASKESNDKTDSEDEESAIKRHIRKLSTDELDQLLGSLTEEKRLLLKKIIDDTEPNDNGLINKREITKKAGAVEENNLIENGQSDLNKVQGGSSAEGNTETASSQTPETTENSNKPETQTDNPEVPQKTSESNITSVSKSDVASNSDEGSWKNSDNNLNTFSLNVDPNMRADVVDVQVTAKTENKRETNLADLENVDDSLNDDKMTGMDYLSDQSYFCSQDENQSNLLDDENQPQKEKTHKREAYEQQSEADSIKSLEESFPNSNAYDESGTYSGPLVRVKRKNYNQIKKRSAGLLPDAKVAYFPYKAENDDEDNDEGNEFDDEGFYDRTSNFANRNKGVEDDAADKAENSPPTNNLNPDNSKSSNENANSNTMSLGSDTDSVLSGVEGVDDNLMYSSGVRNRRTVEDSSNDTMIKTERSTLIMDDPMKVASENNLNALQYQENDAFGPLPRSYDGEAARYKRIRRVKQLQDAEQTMSDT